MKILNLYSGLGGNRKKWQNVDVTAVEINEEIAEYYSNQFPYDKNIYMDGTHDPLKPLRNCVHPDLGLHIFEESKREGLFNLNDIKS